MSIMQKLKSMPTSYWVVGLGAAALGVDYLVEGESSIVSSIWRGVAGDRGAERGLPAAPLAARRGAPGRPGAPGAIITQPTMLPLAQVPGLEYMVVPHWRRHHPRRYYPAHEPIRPWARYEHVREHEHLQPRFESPHFGPHRFAPPVHYGRVTAGFDWEE
ncbi:MAG TPA: hypothetical protein VED41_08635 [Solirubrobacteraceae bacterium]|nr:hypothetical protein [Solirubrobacteraceae bacterium]